MKKSWKVSAKRVGVALAMICITLLLANCCWSEKSTDSSGKDNEFYTEFTYSSLMGLEYEKGITRRDPSDVIKVGSTYYLWYTKTSHSSSGYNATIWYATSPDGKTWTEKAEAIKRGCRGAWNEGSVFTPNILVAEGKYYLTYSGIIKYSSWAHLKRTPHGEGISVSDSPEGPWKEFEGNPILWPSKDPKKFDSFRTCDSCLIVRDGKYWLYYKGRQIGRRARETKWGVAIAEKPTGPYIKYEGNPVIKSGHEVLVWPYHQGVAALIGPTGPEKNTVQYAPDGLHFSVKAHVENVPRAPGAYRPDAFTNTKLGEGITWGISQHSGQWPYLMRYDCDLSLKNERTTEPDRKQ